MEKKSNTNRGLVISVIVVFICFLASIGYIIYDKYNMEMNMQKKEEQEKQKLSLVKGNTFDLTNIDCTMENDVCVKKLTVAYNGKNHEVTFKLLQQRNEDADYEENNENYCEEEDDDCENVVEKYIGYDLKYEMYIDDKLIEKFDQGTKFINANEYKSFDTNLVFGRPHEKIYVFDNKYIGFLRVINSNYIYGDGYNLILYKNGKRIGNEIVIKEPGVSISGMDETKNFIFDGKKFKYYQLSCESNKVVEYSISTDGKKIIREAGEKISDYEIGNDDETKVSCYSEKEDKMKVKE